MTWNERKCYLKEGIIKIGHMIIKTEMTNKKELDSFEHETSCDSSMHDYWFVTIQNGNENW